MLLQNKTTVIYGAGGAVGGAVARAFAREGARVFLAGRTLDPIEALAKEIGAAAAQVDALDKAAVDAHVAAVAAEAGSIDVCFNAVGIDHIQATPLLDLSLADFPPPIPGYPPPQSLPGTAAARHMVPQRSGVIITLTATATNFAGPSDGFGPACAAVEALTRQLAGELGPHGIRAVCLRSHAITETAALGSHARDIWTRFAAAAGMSVDDFLAEPGPALLGRGPALADVANTAAFLASDWANSMTATITNVSAGWAVD